MIKIIALILTFFLSGCASFLQAPITTNKPVNHYLPWAQRKAQLNTLQNWQANGNIAIHASKGSGANASFSWQQIQRNYQLRLFGPLGIQSILLSGNPQQVTLFARNQVVSADNAESLLAQQTGLHLPVSQLYYWLRGLPAPQLRYTICLDAYNRLLKLRQSGWRIEYLHYTNVGKSYSQQWDFRQGAAKMSNRSVYGIHEDCELSGNTAENSSAKSMDIPDQIVLTNPQWKIRILVTHWDIN